MVPSEEAARRLGVKVTTLYAYVSRGLLASHPEPGGRRSLFALADIERLAARRSGGRQVESRLATITTGVTQLRQDGPCYRGRPATELASQMTFEEVAALLWEADAEGDWRSPDLGECPLVDVSRPDALGARHVRGRRPLAGRPAARRPSTRAARRVIAALTDVVGEPASGTGGPAGSIALRLAHAPGRWRGRRQPGPPRRNSGPRPPGRSRACHVHGGRSAGGVHPGRSLRRAAGRAGHPGRAAARRRRANAPTSCWWRSSGTARSGASTTSCAGTTPCPGSGTRSTKTATLASPPCGSWPHPLLSEERRGLFLEVIERGGGQRRAPAELRSGAGRPELGDRHARPMPAARSSPWPGSPGGPPTTRRSCRSAPCASGPAPSTASRRNLNAQPRAQAAPAGRSPSPTPEPALQARSRR